MREQFEKAQKDCFAVLNDDQMLDWTNMCGKTFKFPERQRSGRGNRQGAPPAQSRSNKPFGQEECTMLSAGSHDDKKRTGRRKNFRRPDLLTRHCVSCESRG